MIINSEEMKVISKIKNSFYVDFKIEFLFHSNHIEGSTFSKENLEKSIHDLKVEEVHSYDDVIETKNSVDLFDKVISSCDEEINKFMLVEWHRLLKKGSVDEEIHNIGAWKKYENRLRGVDLRLAQPHEVDTLMYNLLMDWKDSSKTLKDITDFHYRFEKIHPFQDGNGRIGRFVILKQCIESDVDLIAIDEVYEKEYKEALFKAQKTDDSECLINVFKKCQERLVGKMLHYFDLLSQVKKECLIEHENNDFDIER